MFFKFSQERIGELRSLLMPFENAPFTDAEFELGINTLENLINIEVANSDFDLNYADYINETPLTSTKIELPFLINPEAFLRKIETLKEHPSHGMLNRYYTNIGFYDWLNIDAIKAARANDPANADNAQNLPGEGFHLNEADATKYIGCPNFFYDYIFIYQLRNKITGHRYKFTGNHIDLMNAVKSLFILYLHQCIINADLINRKHEIELIENKINFIKYAEDHLAAFSDFNNKFLQLEWKNIKTGEPPFSYTFDSCVKFIGEAGMGKTTQMRKMYLHLLEQVAAGEVRLLPVWIKLSDLSEIETLSLKDKILEALDKYSQYYSLLLKNNTIALFLDGYNEVLTKDLQDAIKRTLSKAIDELHKNYPDLLIVMTDRTTKSTPPCLTKNVQIYTFTGMTPDEMSSYFALKTTPEQKAKLDAYLSSADSAWLKTITIIPEKLNSLIELLNKEEEESLPCSEDDFYEQYLDCILEREETLNKETRIDDLKFLLYTLIGQMSDTDDEKTMNEILNIWLPLAGNLPEARRLLKLALELPILVPGKSDNSYRFAHTQYFHKLQD